MSNYEAELPDLAELLQSQNSKLEAASAAQAERAFGLGCSVTVAPALILLALVFLFTRSWIVSAMLLVGESLLALSLAAYVANRASAGAIRRTYQETALPALESWLAANSSSPEALRQAAQEHLPAEAPLRRMLNTTLSPGPSPKGEGGNGEGRERTP